MPTVDPTPTIVGRPLERLSLSSSLCEWGFEAVFHWSVEATKSSIEGNRLGNGDCYNGISCKEVSRYDVRNRRNYVNMDDRFHKRKVIPHEKKNTCTFVKEEKSREEKVKSFVSTKEREGKIKEIECLIENYESLKEEQEKEKQDEIEKSEETKEEMSLMIFEGDKRETCGTKPNHGTKVKEDGTGKLTFHRTKEALLKSQSTSKRSW
ncbi:hypothetical protein M9H77_07924 [Catharanthus roseus]|uniref:Uncharacterized protein n=1 Tax=Catharanthus roseus TaxID=4058 RepID=A0ACC0BWI7_CATRO|nr:hypothetical protein M9H77_07924 [Catharanthus roseus]